MHGITLDEHTVESIKKISDSALHPTTKTKFMSMLTGVALTVTCLCSANMIHPDDINTHYPKSHNTITIEKTAGEKFIDDPAAIYKMATWIHDRYGMPTQMSYEIVQTVISSSLSLSQDPFLILAIIDVESNFNPSVVSGKNAQGIIQVNANVHGSMKGLIIKDQVEKGLGILLDFKYMAKTDNITELLQRYNGNLKDKDTKYANKVLAMKKVFEDLIVNDLNTLPEYNEHFNIPLVVSDVIVTTLETTLENTLSN